MQVQVQTKVEKERGAKQCSIGLSSDGESAAPDTIWTARVIGPSARALALAASLRRSHQAELEPLVQTAGIMQPPLQIRGRACRIHSDAPGRERAGGRPCKTGYLKLGSTGVPSILCWEAIFVRFKAVSK